MTVSQQLESLGRALADRHLVAGAAGNISIMDENGLIYITARGTRLDSITDADVVCIQKDGSTKGQKAPTSEHLIHTSVYSAFPDIHVVAHTHSTYATAAAVLRKDIPPIVDEMTILLGGGLTVAEYGAPGSAELAQNAVAAMGDKRAALLANHGAVIAAETVEEAVKLAELCEHVAQVFLGACAAGTIHAIPEEAFAKQRSIYLKKTGRGGERSNG